MGGLGVLFFLWLYVYLGYKIFQAMKESRYAKWVALVILILIPSADAAIGRLYLQRLCATEAGLKVYRVVQGAEGFSGVTSDDWVKNRGFQFSESTPMNGLVYRYSRQGEQIIREEKVSPKSLYQLRHDSVNNKDIYPRYSYYVAVISTGEVLAAYTNIGYSGGWAERFLAGFSDAGRGTVARCESRIDPLTDVVINSLKP